MCISTSKFVGIFVCCVLLATVAESLPMRESSSRIQITKRGAPRRARPREYVVQTGHDIELQCRANGPTPPLIHWLFNGEHVEQSPLDHLSENLMAPPNPNEAVDAEDNAHDYFSISTLIIKDANPEKAGQYTCIADLPDERQSKTYNVQVTPPTTEEEISQYLKRNEDSEEDDNEVEDTRIYLYTASVYEFEGVSTRLICRATQGVNKSPPTINWTLNDQQITNQTSGYQVATNGDLKILRTSAVHHMANLKCTAVGSSGKIDVKEPFVYLFEPTK